MAGLFNKIQQLWNVPDDEYEEFEEEIEDTYEEVPARGNRRSERIRETRANRRGFSYFETEEQPSSFAQRSPLRAKENSENNKVVNINATTQLKVVVFRPDRFGEETRNIADELLKMHTVVLNLENTVKDQSRRIVDFLSGLAYSNGGKIKRIATDTFIITPYNVDLMGDSVLDELENSGVYF